MTTATNVRTPVRRSARYWAVEMIPQYLLGVATVVFVATKFNAVRSAAESLQAVAVLTAIGFAWLAFSLLLLPWLVHRQWLRVTIGSVVAIALAWVLFANAYQDKRVVERLPGLESSARPDALDAAVVDPPIGSTLPSMPAAPVRVRAASLRGINHRASGTASIIRQPNGTYVVGLEDIDIEPGPDYRVFLVPGNVTRPGDGAIELDELRGNVGTQYYDVPRDADPTQGEWTVLVWCRVFAVPIAAAVPAPA